MLLACYPGCRNSLELRENFSAWLCSVPCSLQTLLTSTTSSATSTASETTATTNIIITRAKTDNKTSTGFGASTASSGRRDLSYCLSRCAQSEILILLLYLCPLAEIVAATSNGGNGCINDGRKAPPGSANFKTKSSTTTTTTNATIPAIPGGGCARALSKRFYNDETLVAPAKTESLLDSLGAIQHPRQPVQKPLALSSGVRIEASTASTAAPAKTNSSSSKSNRRHGRRREKAKKKAASGCGGNGESVMALGDNEERAMKKDIVSKAIKKLHKKNKKVHKKLHKLEHKTKHNLHQLAHSVHG